MKIKAFPEIPSAAQGWLDVGRGHLMHWQTSGNPNGTPVVWLHGGPGSSASPLHRRFFDPDKFWIIQYDQRGCGRSTPAGETEANQTSDLVNDLELLRHHLRLSRWSVVGGSWGGALALLYAKTYPRAVERMLLRSPFLCTAAEIENFMEFPPEACRARWQLLKDQLPEGSEETILEFGYRVFCLERDALAQSRLARAWMAYEAAMNVYPSRASDVSAFDDTALIARYRVLSHYLKHQCFVDHDVLSGIRVLAELNLTLVHGDQDALCPFANSLAIQSALPQTQLLRVAGGAHDLTDAGMMAATFSALQKWS